MKIMICLHYKMTEPLTLRRHITWLSSPLVKVSSWKWWFDVGTAVNAFSVDKQRALLLCAAHLEDCRRNVKR